VEGCLEGGRNKSGLLDLTSLGVIQLAFNSE